MIAATELGGAKVVVAVLAAVGFGQALVVAGTAVVLRCRSVRYAPRPKPTPDDLSDRSGDGWQQLQARRTELDGDHGTRCRLADGSTPTILASQGVHLKIKRKGATPVLLVR